MPASDNPLVRSALWVAGSFVLLALVLRVAPSWREGLLEVIAWAGPWWGFGLFSAFYNIALIPFPYDVLLAGAVQVYPDAKSEVLWASIVGCGLAAVVDYVGGYYLAPRFDTWLKRQKGMVRAEAWLREHGPLAVAFASVTPIPFSLVCWMAGVVRVPPFAVLLLAVLTRGARNALVIWVAG